MILSLDIDCTEKVKKMIRQSFEKFSNFGHDKSKNHPREATRALKPFPHPQKENEIKIHTYHMKFNLNSMPIQCQINSKSHKFTLTLTIS